MDTDPSFRPATFSPRKVADGRYVPSTLEAAQRRVLVAEDDSLSRKIICKFLGGWGYQTIEAADGQEAMMILRRLDAPPIAILDWEMPAMDGLEICRRVREADRVAYLIMLTGREGKESLVAALDAGADDFLEKPCDPDELQARVRVGERIIGLQSLLADQVRELREAKDQLDALRRRSGM